MYRDDFLKKKLLEREKNGSLRSLRITGNSIDFCSNDYLGIVKHKLLTENAQLASGSTGSRLLTGNYELIEAVEKQIATFHQTPAALLFNSGYDANTGLLSAVPQKGDTILYDQLSHASIRDGIRLSFANAFSFLHNDMADLQLKLEKASGTIFIVTESVFSMDGDTCPLEELVFITKKHNAHLIIDEAHATGVTGEKGEGLVQHLQLQNDIFARVHTFGKACGCHGAVIVGSDTLRNYLINFARSLVFTTALPETAVSLVQQSYTLFPQMVNERQQLDTLVKQFRTADLPFERILSDTPIQAIIIPGNGNAVRAGAKLQQNGFDIRPILYPTVPKGKERLRIVLHAFNTNEELAQLVHILRDPLLTA